MTLNIADRVQETTNTIGTGTLTLLGASPQFTTFSAAVGNGNTTYYSINDGNGIDWEVGLGTVSAGTLTRDTVYSSSNSNSSITLSSSIPHKVFATAPAVLLQSLTSSPTAFPITAAGTTQSVGQMTVSGTNAGIAIVPNGTGALMLAIPDGSSTGGNARGPYAIDLQTLRNDASQVASGPGSILIGEYSRSAGANSTVLGYASGATGSYSVAIGGENAAFSDVAVALGWRNTVSGAGSSAIGVGNISNGGSSFVAGAYGTDRGASHAFIFSTASQKAQLEEYIVEGQASGSSSPFILKPDGMSGEVSASLPANSSWIFYIELVVNDRGNGACIYTMGPGLAWRDGGNIIMGTGNPVFVLGPSAGTTTSCIMATVPTVTADTTRQGFTITITPNSGLPGSMVVTARIRATWAF